MDFENYTDNLKTAFWEYQAKSDLSESSRPMWGPVTEYGKCRETLWGLIFCLHSSWRVSPLLLKVCISTAPSYILLVKLGNPETLSHSHYSVYWNWRKKKRKLFYCCCSEISFLWLLKVNSFKIKFLSSGHRKKVSVSFIF